MSSLLGPARLKGRASIAGIVRESVTLLEQVASGEVGKLLQYVAGILTKRLAYGICRAV